MGLTKEEKRKLRSLRNKANRLGSEAKKLAREVDKELVKQMRKS